MATAYKHRIFIIATLARATTINNWIKANLDPPGANWLQQPASASGNTPATHLFVSAALTTPQARQLMRAIANALGETKPDAGGTFDRAAWKAWLAGIVATLRTKGVSIQWSDNDGTWGVFDAELTTFGLQRISPPRA